MKRPQRVTDKLWCPLAVSKTTEWLTAVFFHSSTYAIFDQGALALVDQSMILAKP